MRAMGFLRVIVSRVRVCESVSPRVRQRDSDSLASWVH